MEPIPTEGKARWAPCLRQMSGKKPTVPSLEKLAQWEQAQTQPYRKSVATTPYSTRGDIGPVELGNDAPGKTKQDEQPNEEEAEVANKGPKFNVFGPVKDRRQAQIRAARFQVFLMREKRELRTTRPV